MGTLSRQGVFSRVLISHIHWEAVMIPIATRAVQLAYRGKHFFFFWLKILTLYYFSLFYCRGNGAFVRGKWPV